MNVLVTGGAGYIGCEVVRELLNRGHSAIVFDTFYWGDESVKNLQFVRLEKGDCRNSSDVLHALEGADAVIHLAGIVGEFACKTYPKAHFSSNVESTRTLINCCTDPEVELVRDFIYASSCSVYGNVKGIYDEVLEDTPTMPLTAYAHAKLRSEEIILNRAKEVPHFHPTIMRLTTVFGWSERPRLDLVTNLFTYQAWKNKKITVHGGGSQYRSLIHVKDVASALVTALEAPRHTRDRQTFHVGEEDNNKTVLEIAEIVKRRIPDTRIISKTNQASDKRDYKINCQKIRNTLNWQAQYSVDYGVIDLISYLNTRENCDWESYKYRNNSFEYK